ncbi:GNAT family N-acetyltransferase [Acinetobacter sp. HY1485]|uniref:GNAT family N-acetyltransferase n=1 Tax=Acinetobacter sp. HY1485 TaxID=2970918 RepID=UPI0022B9AD44|nr:GNAT family N-acetyltransferase [Acinetobacter sp. HY1485]
MDTYQFRKAISTDLPYILELVNTAYRSKTLRGWTSEADLVTGQRIDINQLKALMTARSDLFVMQFNNELISCVYLKFHSIYCYIGMLTTHQKFQNKGIGKQRLQYAEKYAFVHYSIDEFRIYFLCMTKTYSILSKIWLLTYKSPYSIHANVGMPQAQKLCIFN